jgi:MerR-like DNA binding protein
MRPAGTQAVVADAVVQALQPVLRATVMAALRESVDREVEARVAAALANIKTPPPQPVRPTMTQREVAQAFNVTPHTIKVWEHLGRFEKVPGVRRPALYTRISVERLLSANGEAK